MAKPNSTSKYSIIAGIRDAIEGVIDFGVAGGKQSQMWKVFYDSEIGSPIEKSVEKAVSISVYKALVKVFPNLKQEGKTSLSVARSILFLLDRSKLMYQYQKGWITESKYYEEIAKRYSSIIVTVVRRGEDMLIVTLPHLLEQYCNIPSPVSRFALQKVFEKITPSEEQVSRLVAEGMRRVRTFVENLDKKTSELLQRLDDYIVKKVKPAIREKIDNFVKRLKK